MNVTVLIHAHQYGATAYVIDMGTEKIPDRIFDLIDRIPTLKETFNPETDGLEIFEQEPIIRLR